MARKQTRSDKYAGGFPPGMEAFQNLSDPRTGKAKRHYFGEVTFIALAAMICGICPNLTDRLIAIDGKMLRHRFDHHGPETSIHLISAWVDGCGLTLGQLLVDGKTNEITAVPKLLRQLDINGATVSLDAMGCQNKIAQEIHFRGGHYLLALKANQGTLHDDVRALFNDAEALDYGRKKRHQIDHHDTGPEKSHGRIEPRITKVTDYLDWFAPSERKHWLGLRSLVEITSIREQQGSTSTEKRYYLSTHAPEAAKLGDLGRRHWGIENRCHRVLDMTFDEDHSRVRKGNAAENLALLPKLTLNLLRHDQTIKDTMLGKRIQAALSESILETLLKITIPK